jgi:hypothetical protein
MDECSEDVLIAMGGLCAVPAGHRDPLGRWDPLWVPPRFRPLRGWRTWFRRGDAGGPLLGHVTPPVSTVRVKDLLPVFTAPRGPFRFVAPR